ncbi:unnamed protein product [Ambrosiozyma monospora]|uniref:Unnamed protein product n=1 Tax=Ambrosiozyma monospora TaxID=43982 RepID=A0ACB5TKS2_AMBMO|nr:unnamed protein product [Ambrosiozyma monospora]
MTTTSIATGPVSPNSTVVSHKSVLAFSSKKKVNSSKLVTGTQCYDELYVDCPDTLDRLPKICYPKIIKLKTTQSMSVYDIKDKLPNLKYVEMWIGTVGDAPYDINKLELFSKWDKLQSLSLNFKERFTGLTPQDASVLLELGRKPNFKLRLAVLTKVKEMNTSEWIKIPRELDFFMNHINIVVTPESGPFVCPDLGSFTNIESYQFDFYKFTRKITDCEFTINSESLKELNIVNHQVLTPCVFDVNLPKLRTLRMSKWILDENASDILLEPIKELELSGVKLQSSIHLPKNLQKFTFKSTDKDPHIYRITNLKELHSLVEVDVSMVRMDAMASFVAELPENVVKLGLEIMLINSPGVTKQVNVIDNESLNLTSLTSVTDLSIKMPCKLYDLSMLPPNVTRVKLGFKSYLKPTMSFNPSKMWSLELDLVFKSSEYWKSANSGLVSCYRRAYSNGKFDLILNVKQLNYDTLRNVDVSITSWFSGVIILAEKAFSQKFKLNDVSLLPQLTLLKIHLLF